MFSANDPLLLDGVPAARPAAAPPPPAPDHLALLVQLLNDRYRQPWLLAELRREFARTDYLKLPALLAPAVFALLHAEIARLLPFAQPKHFTMTGYDTPRIMHTLGGSRILRHSPALAALYAHYDLRHLLQTITHAELFPCRHPDEFMVLNCLRSTGATHGWHLDDPAYALLLVFEAPPAEHGGLLEFIPAWPRWCAQHAAAPTAALAPLVEQARAAQLVQVRHHAPGDAYLFRADECLHRVTELYDASVPRVVLNLAFEVTPQPHYGLTASLLYGED